MRKRSWVDRFRVLAIHPRHIKAGLHRGILRFGLLLYRRLLLAIRFISIFYGFCALAPGKNCESDRYHESKAYGSKCDPLPPCCSLPLAIISSVCSAVGWRSFSAELPAPSFSRTQIFTAQNKAVVPAVCFPLNCSGKQARVRPYPFEIGIQRANQSISSLAKIVTLPKENPVQLP